MEGPDLIIILRKSPASVNGTGTKTREKNQEFYELKFIYFIYYTVIALNDDLNDFKANIGYT